MDILLLKMLKHRNQYEALIPGLPRDAFDRKTLVLVNAFGDWFDNYTDTPVIDIEDFKTWFFTFKARTETRETKDYYNKILDQCVVDPSPKETEGIASKLIELGLATKVANLCQQYNDGHEINIVDRLGVEYENALQKMMIEEEDFHIATSIGDLLDEDQHNEGLVFDLTCLRDNIRPLRASDFIILAGRPDTGKTSFIASQLPSLIKSAPQSGRPALWFNNEGIGSRIIKRLYQATLDATVEDLLHLREQGSLDYVFRERFGGIDPYRVVDCHGWGIQQVEKAVKHYNPCIVVFDMLDNITFPAAEDKVRTDQILEAKYQWARELGVRYDFPVIATSQISAEAEQQADTQCWPRMSMLKDSKTGKQGAADTIIMIGRSADPDMDGYRYISAPKNKLSLQGRRIKHEVVFDGPKSQYKD